MKPEEQKQAMEELAKGVAPMVTPLITKEVLKGVMDELPKVMNQGGESNEQKAKVEQKTKAVEYFKGVINSDRAKVRANAKAVFGNEGTSTEGQEWAPEYFEGNIIEIAKKYGLVRQKAQHVPLAGRKVTWPTGGEVTAYKVLEGASIKARKPASSSFSMEPEKLGVLIPVSKELLEDNNLIPGLVDYLNVIAGRAFAKLEDAMGLGVTGSSSGEGVLKKSGVPAKTIAGTGFADVTFEELLEASELVDDDVDGLEWVMSRSMRNILLNKRMLVDSDKQQFIFGNPGGTTPRTMWDYPMTLSRSMPKRGDSAQSTAFMALVSWANVMFGDRRQYKVELSDVASFVGTDDSTPVYAFAQDIVVVKFTERIDIDLANHTEAFAVVKTAASGS